MRHVARFLLAAVALLLAATASAAPAGAQPILSDEDAAELANKLAEATEEQDVCYGWVVEVRDDDGTASGTDRGSSLGPGRSVADPSCPQTVSFIADIHYTSSFSESEDSASFRVESTFPGFDSSSLSRLGVSVNGLLGENDDAVLFNAVSLLPILVAEQGLAPPVGVEETVGTIPAGDRPTGGGGSDRWRTYGTLFVLAGLTVVGGIGWLVFGLAMRSDTVRAHLASLKTDSYLDR